MRIRNPFLVRMAGMAASVGARSLISTLRFEYAPLGERLSPRDLAAENRDRYIYAIWHEHLLLPAVRFGDPSLAVLISRHTDGQILGPLVRAMGMSMVQGSTNRGGVQAVRELLDPAMSRRHLAVTPDGPRGPRRIVQPGIVYIASRTGMKIIAVGTGYRSAWRLGSWDRFAIPKPASRAKIVTTQPIAIPANLKMSHLEHWRMIVQAEMDRVTEQAESFGAQLPLVSCRRAA